jgi:hypothetical protein
MQMKQEHTQVNIHLFFAAAALRFVSTPGANACTQVHTGAKGIAVLLIGP